MRPQLFNGHRDRCRTVIEREDFSLAFSPPSSSLALLAPRLSKGVGVTLGEIVVEERLAPGG